MPHIVSDVHHNIAIVVIPSPLTEPLDDEVAHSHGGRRMISRFGILGCIPDDNDQGHAKIPEKDRAHALADHSHYTIVVFISSDIRVVDWPRISIWCNGHVAATNMCVQFDFRIKGIFAYIAVFFIGA